MCMRCSPQNFVKDIGGHCRSGKETKKEGKLKRNNCQYEENEIKKEQ